MSDAIREAFEDAVTRTYGLPKGCLKRLRAGHSYKWEAPPIARDAWPLMATALQSSQTAPAVPEELTELLNRISPPMRGQAIKGDPTELFHTGHDVYLAQRVKEWLNAPQPDHSPDTGEVVPFGFVDSDSVRDFMSGKELFIAVYRPEACESWASKAPLYTHPAESREEIQAQALRAMADKYYESDKGADCSTYSLFADDLREEADRLLGRSAGDDSEDEPHG